MGNIEDDSLRENILVYYQQTLPNLADDEGFSNSYQLKLLDFEVDKSNISINDFLNSTKAKSLLQLSTNNLGNTLDDYDSAVKRANVIIRQIDNEIRQ